MTEEQQSTTPGPATSAAPGRHPGDVVRTGLVVGALGVVFGDIGTSPIYTLATVFNPADPHPVPVSTGNVYGVVSLIFWSVVVIVTVTYVLLAMRADNQGEGGIMALITLLRRPAATPAERLQPEVHTAATPAERLQPEVSTAATPAERLQPEVFTAATPAERRGWRAAGILVGLGLFGAALFLGDSMITPAISVLSAVEGLKVVQPSLHELVVPITAVIIVVLFLVQRRGTAAVGRLFGPVMIAWFLTIGACGVAGIARHPAILKALSPTYALGFLAGHFGTAFFALAAVVLAVTGAEALYADMGHFGRRSITRAWLVLVFPACVLSYLGQGALVLADRNNLSGPFFLLAPAWGRLPLVLLATAATVIAAQAVITGAYSVAAQAAELGYLPRLRVAHTSESTIGQVYVPWINWLLLVSVLTLVFAFRSSAALAFAYGMAVTGTITITTLMFFYVARLKWHTPRWLLGTGAAALLLVDLLFLAANLTKLVHGAWLPLLIGVTAYTVMTTWQRGRRIVTAERERREGSLREFVTQLRDNQLPTVRVPGTAVFLNRGKQTAPLALRANVEHNHVRHDQLLIIAILTEPVPRVPADERTTVDPLGYADDGITHVIVRFGYMETPNLPEALRGLDPADTEGPLHLDQASYFLSKIELRAGAAPTMARWRKRLFIATSHITADAAEHFGLPRERTVIMGSHIEV